MPRYYAVALITGLLASTSAFAQQDVADQPIQSNAVNLKSTKQASAATRDANRLGAAVTAYNKSATSGAINPAILDGKAIADNAPSAEALALAHVVSAYNGELRPTADVDSGNHNPNSQVVALGREIKRFNQSGGSLAVID